MSAEQVHLVNLRCDGCGKKAVLLAESAKDARKRARSWTTWRLQYRVYDICPRCKPPEGARQTK